MATVVATKKRSARSVSPSKRSKSRSRSRSRSPKRSASKSPRRARARSASPRRGRSSSPKRRNAWIAYLKANKGKGLSIKDLKQGYATTHKKASPKRVVRKVKSARKSPRKVKARKSPKRARSPKNRWNKCEKKHGGLKLSPAKIHQICK